MAIPGGTALPGKLPCRDIRATAVRKLGIRTSPAAPPVQEWLPDPNAPAEAGNGGCHERERLECDAVIPEGLRRRLLRGGSCPAHGSSGMPEAGPWRKTEEGRVLCCWTVPGAGASMKRRQRERSSEIEPMTEGSDRLPRPWDVGTTKRASSAAAAMRYVLHRGKGEGAVDKPRGRTFRVDAEPGPGEGGRRPRGLETVR
jgi:hypothetical protein